MQFKTKFNEAKPLKAMINKKLSEEKINSESKQFITQKEKDFLKFIMICHYFYVLDRLFYLDLLAYSYSKDIICHHLKLRQYYVHFEIQLQLLLK